MSDSTDLLAPRFLFHFELPVKEHRLVGAKLDLGLDASYRLMRLAALDEATSFAEPEFADVRLAWGSAGLAVEAKIDGKRQLPWCRESRLEESDGLQLWIDTRATHNIHRASKFCHRFAFLPLGGSGRGDKPLADQLLINRARENARPVRPRELQISSQVTKNGYRLCGFIPAVALGGFDPQQHGKLGFTYAVIDRELGVQTFASGPGFPYEEDPSCWATLVMTE